MLQPDRLAYYFSLTHELPGVEFKSPGKGRENPLFGKVVRAAMAMANRRGGGTIIIGVSEAAKEKSTILSFDGLNADLLATWKYEHIASGFNSYTSVPIQFERLEYEYQGNTFLVLDIHEFASVPIMCMKEYRDKTNPKMPDDQRKVILRPGAFYIRTLNNAESKEMLTSEETRTLFELAIDKGVQSFVTHTKLAGVNIAPLPEDKELFARQVQDWTGRVLEEIRTHSYWDIHIRPVTFQQERKPLSQLYQLVASVSLNSPGEEFPIIPPQPQIGRDWIGFQWVQGWVLQAWCFFQSGQFAIEVGDKYADSRHLSVQEVIFRLTEVFRLASRLATIDIYGTERSMVIDLTLCHAQDHELFGQGIDRNPLYGYTTADKYLPYTVTLAKEDIIARPQELARDAARYIFERFGWNPSDQLLATIQSELLTHS